MLPAPLAAAEDCPTPRTGITPGGVTTLISPELCQLTLTEGANVIYWNRPAQAIDLALAGRTDPAEQLSVWHNDPAQPGWSAWGPGAPVGVHPLETLEPGQIYFIAAPGPTVWDLRPHGRSAFAGRQVVSLYGYPGIRSMGALGHYTPAGAIAAASIEAARYDALNGDIDVVPAVHPIVAVAQPTPMSDGTYLVRMPEATISQYVEAAREAGALVILDFQIGWADPVEELQRLEQFLLEPFVHVALDPEFATASLGAAPGERIGHLTANQINAVQHYLAELVRQHQLPTKALIVHQFQHQMIRNPEQLDEVAEVEITIDMDGFGGALVKTQHYGLFALADASEQPAIKLFYNWDTPLMSPEEIQALEVPPALIIYQ